jgi:hypothetical protein
MVIRRAAKNQEEDWSPKQLMEVRKIARRGGSFEEALAVLETTMTPERVRTKLRHTFNITFERKPRSDPKET